MEILHDPRQRKFYTLYMGVEYSLEYNDIKNRIWEFHCPYLPKNEKEKMIQDKVAEYALFYVKRNGIQLTEICSCPYLLDFLQRQKALTGVNRSQC